MEVRNRKLTLEELQEQRKTVLASWPTGSGVDLEEGIEYSRRLPRHKVLADLLAEAEQEGRTLLNGHGGRALIEEHIQLLKAQREAGMDYLPTGVDSHTRNNRYRDAENGVEESRKAGRSLLNGFPVVYYGVEGCRKVVEAVDQAVIVRTSALDNRLVAEITLASGFTCFVGGAMSGFAVYSNRAPLSQAIRNYQYVNRLAAYYEENGAPIVREFVMYDMGAGGWPPSIEIVMCVVEALLAAEQGVRHMLIHRYFQGNVLQTVADLRVTDKLIKEYLQKSGPTGVNVYESLVTWPGAFPLDEAQAWATVIPHAVVATLAGFRVHNAAKTVEEAHGLPSIAASAAAIRACRHVFNMLRGQRYPHSQELQLEMDVQEREARLILDRIFEMGDGDVALGSERAFQSGVMDLPFSPNKGVKGKVIPARDSTGAVRFLECGDLPFTPEIKAFHRGKLAERGRAEGR
ncbi:MAG: methylaspartate mutase subunit E, partial [Chloroflexota bacterium]